jgi:4-methylaminobutanoate oxidase (formaldehyde-forming)
LRLEKGYVAWGVEVSTETTPAEAGLDFAVSKTKHNFMGKSAIDSAAPPSRKLAVITFDDITNVPLGNEPIKIAGQVVGRVKSGGQGYTIGKAIGNAYLPIDFCVEGTQVDVEFFGEWKRGVVGKSPLFDPSGSRIKS